MSAFYRVKSTVYRSMSLLCGLCCLMCLGNLFDFFLPTVCGTVMLGWLTRLFYLRSLRAERLGRLAARRHRRRMARRTLSAPAAARQPAFSAGRPGELLRTA